MESNGAILLLGVLTFLLSASAQDLRNAANSEELLRVIESAARGEKEKRSSWPGHLEIELDVRSIRSELNSYGMEIDDFLNSNAGELAGSHTPVYFAYDSGNGKTVMKKLDDNAVGRAAAQQIKRLETTNRPTSDAVYTLLAESVKASSKPQDTFTASILITTDYNKTPTKTGRDYTEEIAYQLAFWNAVDLSLRSLSPVPVQLRIAGIIIGLNRTVATSTYNDGAEADHEIDHYSALSGMRTYWANAKKNKSSNFPPFDIVVTMTDSKIIPEPSLKPAHPDNFGVAAEKTICSQPDFESVGIVQDHASFDGYLAALHVITKILGLLDEPHTRECDRIFEVLGKNGRIQFVWSKCYSRKLSSKYLTEARLKCTDDVKELPGVPLRNFLPNEIMTDDQQCKKRGHAGACALDEFSIAPCSRVVCGNGQGPSTSDIFDCKYFYPAMDGRGCKPGYMCVKEECKCMTYECLTSRNLSGEER